MFLLLLTIVAKMSSHIQYGQLIFLLISIILSFAFWAFVCAFIFASSKYCMRFHKTWIWCIKKVDERIFPCFYNLIQTAISTNMKMQILNATSVEIIWGCTMFAKQIISHGHQFNEVIVCSFLEWENVFKLLYVESGCKSALIRIIMQITMLK